MNIGIGLQKYSSYFVELDEEERSQVGSYQPHFLDSAKCCYHDNVWFFRGASKEAHSVDFDVPIAPGKKLTDYPDLLTTLKITAMLSGTIKTRSLGGYGPQNIIKFCHKIINLYRVIFYCFGIENLSSINPSISEKLKEELVKPVAERLDIHKRLTDYFLILEEEDVAKLKVDSGKNFDLDVLELAGALGVSSRLLSKECIVSLTKFRRDNGFYVSSHLKKFLAREHDEPTSSLSADAIRKELSALNKFFSLIVAFEDIIPESQRLSNNFLQDVDPNKLGKRVGKSSQRTKNIPREIFFKLMDRAIRWVVDYADPLIEYRDKALEHYNDMCANESRGGTAENRRHYAAKRMAQFFDDHPLKVFAGEPGAPYPITSFDKNQIDSILASKRTISDDQVQRALSLVADGATYKTAADAVGISKASLSRILNGGWRKPGFGLDKVLHCYLPTACLLVIYCFTARRQVEIESLEAGCCIETTEGPYIRMYSAKVDQAFDYFPTTRLVKKAVSVLEKLSAPVRSGDSQGLLQVPSLQGGHYHFWQSGKINEFANMVEADGDKKNKCVFSEHQFRRFFAMTYFFRYDAGDLPSLSWHMRHSDFEMTMKYLTDSNGHLAVEEVRAEKIIQMAKESGRYGGTMEEDLVGLVESLELQKESRVDRLIARVNDIGLVINYVPDGVCFGDSPTLKLRSSCLEKGAVQRSSAALGTCLGCPNLASFSTPGGVECIVDYKKSPILKAAKERLG